MQQTVQARKKSYNIIMLILASFILVMGLANASTLGTFRLNSCVDLVQTCGNCSYVNISSISYPNGTIINQNVAMTKQGTSYNYTFCGTQQIGQYIYNTVGNPDGTTTTEPVTFNINPQGKEYQTIDGLIYGISLLTLIGVFCLCIFVFIKIPFENPRNEEGNIIQINYKKYLKIFVFMMAYVMLVGISYFLWNISYGIIQFTELAKFFYFLFRLLFVGLLLLFPVTIILSFVKFLKDMSMDNKLLRGLTIK